MSLAQAHWRDSITKPAYRIEVWKSDHNQEERHYFLSNEANTYLFGFNPLLVSEAKANQIIELMLENLSRGQ
jgi:hypothetical protein